MQTEKVERTRRIKRTQQTGMRDGSKMSEGRWMKTGGWRGRVHVWVKKLKERVGPNIEGMRGVKLDKGVNWATMSPTKRPAHH